MSSRSEEGQVCGGPREAEWVEVTGGAEDGEADAEGEEAQPGENAVTDGELLILLEEPKSSALLAGPRPGQAMRRRGKGRIPKAEVRRRQYTAEERLLISPEARRVLLVGFMGAFTTFSTFAFETGQLAREAQWTAAMGNIVAQNILGIGLFLLGLSLGRLL